VISTRVSVGKLPDARRRQRSENQRGQAQIELSIMVRMLVALAIGIVNSGISLTNNRTVSPAAEASALLPGTGRDQATGLRSTAVQARYPAAPDLHHTDIAFAISLKNGTFRAASCGSATVRTLQGANVDFTSHAGWLEAIRI
jgi:hypothetical protein